MRRPALACIFFFFFFAFLWRLASVAYIDVAGPVFAEQLEREIGPGIAAVPIAVSQLIVIAALLFAFSPQRTLELREPQGSVLHPAARGGVPLSDLALAAAVLFAIGLWVELIARGPIPLFVGIERFDYSQQFGGPLHHRLLEWGAMLAFVLGVFFVAPTFRQCPFDRRFGFVFASLLIYLFMVGHRFSSLYAYGSFFLMPIGAALLRKEAEGDWLKATFGHRAVRSFLVMGGGLLIMIVCSVAYSYLIVRRFEGDELITKISQRVLVQQGEMWWATFERIFLRGEWDGSVAFYKLFIEPFDPGRNSTMQFLMEIGLPIERAHEILRQGSAYTGGWPEVLFELGGPLGGMLLVMLTAVIFAEFMFLLVKCIIQERYATCLFLAPILFAISINIVSGMVNSFIQMTFAIKLAAALIVYFTEDKWRNMRNSDSSSELSPRLGASDGKTVI